MTSFGKKSREELDPIEPHATPSVTRKAACLQGFSEWRGSDMDPLATSCACGVRCRRGQMNQIAKVSKLPVKRGVIVRQIRENVP